MKHPRVPRHTRRAAFTLLETAISSLLVGILLAASMQTVGTVYRQRALTADRMTARLLADQLLAEILEFPYQEPDGTGSFGPETDESNDRTLFDDVDDYHNFSESPPKYRDGASMSQWTNWARDVTVENVPASDSLLTTTINAGGIPIGVGLLTGASSGSSGIRRITVTVRRGTTVLATAQGIRTGSWK